MSAAAVYSGANHCIQVTVPVANNFWQVDGLSVGLAFFFGLIFGALLCLCCAKLCMKDVQRVKTIPLLGKIFGDRLQDVEGQYMKQRGLAGHESDKLIDKDDEKNKKKKSLKQKKNKKRGRSLKSAKGRDESLVPVTVITLDEVGSSGDGVDMSNVKGLADALMMSNSEGMAAELSNQDIEAVDQLDKELREESINTMVQMLRVMLNKQMVKGKLSDEQYTDLMQQMQNSVSDVVNAVQKERQEEQEELEKKFEKDPDKLEDELDKLHPKYINKMNDLMKDQKEKIRKNMAKTTELNDEEIDIMLAEYTNNMANMENKMADERNRQAKVLEDRLARRRQLAEQHAADKKHQKSEIEYRKNTYEDVLDKLVDDGKMLERQKQDLLDAYADDVHKVQMVHEEEVQKQQLHLAEKLKRNREARLARLAEDQESQREELLKSLDASTSSKSSMGAYHELMQQQRMERVQLSEDLDEEEAKALAVVTKDLEEDRQESLGKVEETLQDRLQAQAQLTDKEASRILKTHQQAMDEFERIKKDQKKQMKRQLQEKLEQRKMRAEEEAARRAEEQAALKEQQANTIRKVLESQTELTSDAKDQIMREHEKNVNAVNNQIEMSRLRQQKRLEAKLNARKAKVADLKQKQEDAKMDRQKEKEKIAEQLQKQIEEEERKLENEKKSRLAALRARLSAETEEALKSHEREMGLLIGKLQVGAARRQEVLRKQDEALKELEEQMAEKITEKVEEEGTDVPDRQVENLLLQHQAQATNLTDKMEEERDRQQRILQEKLQAKKLKKERVVENKLEDEAEQEWKDQRKRGAGLATSILGQVMLETRHKAAMKQLDHDLSTEMAKQREELNREMEEELKLELAEQKKRFLATLAAMSNMSKNEITDVVENAVNDSGGSEKQAKKLAKELRIEMKRAKTDLQDDEQDDDRYSRDPRRARSEMEQEDYDDYQARQRPKSSKKRRPKSAFKDDDDF